MKARNGQSGVGLVEPVPLLADGNGIPDVIVVDVGRIVGGACRRFARAVDWQHRSHIASNQGNGGLQDLGPGYRLSENHEGLHSGRYISVSVVLAANALSIRGGYHDRCWQPKAVYSESVPLGEVTAEGLCHLLVDMHDGLGKSARAQST